MEFFIGQLFGFMIGILSSLTFMYLLSLTKPNLAFSPSVAHDETNNELHVRVLNKGRRYVSEITVTFIVGEETPHNGFVRVYQPTLNADSYVALAPIGQWRRLWTVPTATTVKGTDADKILNFLCEKTSGERRLVFTVTGIDALTSSRTIIRKTYSYAQVVKGTFVQYSITDIQKTAESVDPISATMQ